MEILICSVKQNAEIYETASHHRQQCRKPSAPIAKLCSCQSCGLTHCPSYIALFVQFGAVLDKSINVDYKYILATNSVSGFKTLQKKKCVIQKNSIIFVIADLEVEMILFHSDEQRSLQLHECQTSSRGRKCHRMLDPSIFIAE
ncbi:hypothetical protein CAPTEDRAFT_200200 [Capitella teleta]|uniref:Uncharacterized protein n=1 Tax=Capitella teleta TaxID=283909 RepID=R7V365_CAPTE|nr:hypothetical protein CAPTEDRAFT_200200 [Capitella teleta]|eukprot:ELU10766.1 hypothetical protein CAPTEDRAFT_200200 [Capitella teleta]